MKIHETLGKKIAPKISIGVLGSSSWATSLVKILTDSKINVNWCVREPEQVQKIKATSKNPNYLTIVKFRPKKITVSSNINEVVSRSEWLVLAIPSAYLGDELKLLTQHIKNKIIVKGVKGILPESQLITGEPLHQHYDLPWDNFTVIG